MTTDKSIDWKELEKYVKNDYQEDGSKKYKSVIDVLNQTLLIKGFRFEEADDRNNPGTKRTVLILVTDLGEIRTSSMVLIKKIKAVEPHFNASTPIKTVIKAVRAKNGKGTYYDFQSVTA